MVMGNGRYKNISIEKTWNINGTDITLSASGSNNNPIFSLDVNGVPIDARVTQNGTNSYTIEGDFLNKHIMAKADTLGIGTKEWTAEMTMPKKYELTTATIEHEGRTLHMIKALKDFGEVKAGDLGGFIENEDNLSHIGNAWVADKAKVYEKGAVRGDAVVSENAEVFGKAQVIGNSQVYGDAKISGKAMVYNQAKVYGEAQISGNAQICENGVVHGDMSITEGEITEDIMKNELKEWLKEQVKDVTRGEMTSSIEPASYDDKLSADTVLKAFNEYCRAVERKNPRCETFEDYLNETTAPLFEESIFYHEEWLLDQIENKLSSAPANVQEAYEELKAENTVTWEILEMGGYTGTGVEMHEFLDMDYHINIMLATDNERNSDMSAITAMFHGEICDSTSLEDKFFNEESHFTPVVDNALTYLVHQQGYELDAVYQSWVSGKESENAFVKSVVDEVNDNYYGGCTELTAMVSLKGEELLTVLDNIAHGTNNLSFSKETEMGLFNEWSGAGSALEIALEQPAVFPADMVRNVQFEGASKDTNDGYTVDDVYGLIGSVWEKGSVTVTEEAPTLKEENMKETQAKLKSYVEAEQKKQDKNKDDYER